MGKPSKKPLSRSPGNSAARAASAATLPSAGDNRTGLSTTTSGDSDAADLNPHTCCSNCQTIFEVSLELLSSTDTRVRCGECLSIFDALANLRDMNAIEEEVQIDATGNVVDPDSEAVSSPSQAATNAEKFSGTSNLPNASAAALAGLSNDTSSLDVTYSDFDLFSADAGLPEVTYFDQTRDTPSFDFNEVVDEEGDETFSDTLFARDVTVDARSAVNPVVMAKSPDSVALDKDVDYVTDEIPREPLTFNYRERETLTPGSASAASPYDPPPDPRVYGGMERETPASIPSNPWIMRILLFFVAVTLAGGLYAYQQRDTLSDNAVIRPVLESACRVLFCEVPARYDLDALRAVSRTVVSHPTLANALIIEFGIVNEAAFSQPYPVLEIRLTDRAGRLVVTNSFSPSDYSRGWQAGDVMDIGKRLDVSLTVEDPGNTAISFELDFRKQRR